MTAKDSVKLEFTAQSLPKMQTPIIRERSVLGLIMIENYKTKVYQGKLVDPKRVYHNVPLIIKWVQVNHLRELKRIFNHSGWKGVTEYQWKVHRDYQEIQRRKKDIIEKAKLKAINNA